MQTRGKVDTLTAYPRVKRCPGQRQMGDVLRNTWAYELDVDLVWGSLNEALVKVDGRKEFFEEKSVEILMTIRRY